jgi:hypothetical protein
MFLDNVTHTIGLRRNRALSEAYLNEYANSYLLDPSVASPDYVKYMTKSLISRGYLHEHASSLDYLYRLKLEDLFNSKFKDLFLYSYDRSLQGVYPTVKEVRAMGPVGFFDLISSLITTVNARLLPPFELKTIENEDEIFDMVNLDAKDIESKYKYVYTEITDETRNSSIDDVRNLENYYVKNSDHTFRHCTIDDFYIVDNQNEDNVYKFKDDIKYYDIRLIAVLENNNTEDDGLTEVETKEWTGTDIIKYIEPGWNDYGLSSDEEPVNQNLNQTKVQLDRVASDNKYYIKINCNYDTLDEWTSTSPSQQDKKHKWYALNFVFNKDLSTNKCRWNGTLLVSDDYVIDSDGNYVVTLWVKIDEIINNDKIVIIEHEDSEDDSIIEEFVITAGEITRNYTEEEIQAQLEEAERALKLLKTKKIQKVLNKRFIDEICKAERIYKDFIQNKSLYNILDQTRSGDTHYNTMFREYFNQIVRVFSILAYTLNVSNIFEEYETDLICYPYEIIKYFTENALSKAEYLSDFLGITEYFSPFVLPHVFTSEFYNKYKRFITFINPVVDTVETGNVNKSIEEIIFNYAENMYNHRELINHIDFYGITEKINDVNYIDCFGLFLMTTVNFLQVFFMSSYLSNNKTKVRLNVKNLLKTFVPDINGITYWDDIVKFVNIEDN